MKKIYKLITIILVTIFMITGSTFITSSNNRYKSINEILSKEYYSYLPEEAIDYIKETYESTGDLILTEKNKEDNSPYLNPEYINYLTLSEDEQKKVDAIPESIIVDYQEPIAKADTLPSKYNLAAVDTNGDGKADANYTTPMKNQAELGICWAMTTSESAETYLMLKNKKTYKAGETLVLSPRQLDYVTSRDGVKNYSNEYANHDLGEGSSFSLTSKVLAEGPTMFSESWPYTLSLSYDKLNYHEVFDSQQSVLEVNKTIQMPVLNIKNLDLTKSANVTLKNNYLKTIKQLIRTYGGPYVGTMAPNFPCAAVNSLDSSGLQIIDVDGTCTKDGSHAMQVIGWDDNYQYKYCIDGKQHTKWTSSCSSSNTVTGKGAWILRNSWGESSKNKYTYLTYESTNSYFGFITDLNTEKKWDTTFSQTEKNLETTKTAILDSSNKSWTRAVATPNTKFNVNAKLYKIKYKASVQNATYRVYLSTTGLDKDYVKLSEEVIEYPGYSTVDLSNYNYIITNNSKVMIESSAEKYNFEQQCIALLTKDTTGTKQINAPDVIYTENNNNMQNNLYKVNIPSTTYNIPSGTNLTYEIYNQSGSNITSSTVIENTVVANNKTNTIVYVPKPTNGIFYTVKIKINNTEIATSQLMLSHVPSEGKGTVSNPYVIKTPEELYSINNLLDKHFVLGNDIDMTDATQKLGGFAYNNGEGWNGIGSFNSRSFNGSLNGYYNGRYHKIIGMKIGENGLFAKLVGEDNPITIKNIIFEDCIINSSALISDTIESVSNTINIENIAVIDSKFKESRLLANNIHSYIQNGVVINNIYTDSTFDNEILGLISYENAALDRQNSNATLEISNIEFLGRVINQNVQSALFAMAQGTTNISNILYNYKQPAQSHIVYVFYKSPAYDAHKPTLKNVYYIGNVQPTGNSTEDDSYIKSNVTKKSISSIKNSSSYNTWQNFTSSWKYNTNRIPSLKFINLEQTNITDFEILEGVSKNITDYVTPNKDAAMNVSATTTTPKIISIQDGVVTGLSAGLGRLHVVNNYDGTEKDITVKVIPKKVTVTIINTDTGQKGTAEVDNFSTVKLSPNVFTKTGYKFKNWNTKEDGTGTTYEDRAQVSLTDNLTLYTMWTPIKYSIKYDSNTGTGTMTDSTGIEYDKQFELKENTYTKENYIFSNWNTKKDGTGKSYNNKAKVMNLTASEETITLYAIWIDPSDILNSFYDNSVYYDGKEHTIDVRADLNNINIKYSYNGSGYTLTEIPKFKDIGEYEIGYQITMDTKEVKTGSKVLKIYGLNPTNKVNISNDIIVYDGKDYMTMLENIEVYADTTKVELKDSSNKTITRNELKTGDKLKVILNGEKEYTFNIAILGDVNGDGTIDIIDYIRIMKDITKDTKLSGAYRLAADMNKNNEIDIIDYIRVMRIILEENK